MNVLILLLCIFTTSIYIYLIKDNKELMLVVGFIIMVICLSSIPENHIISIQPVQPDPYQSAPQTYSDSVLLNIIELQTKLQEQYILLDSIMLEQYYNNINKGI